MNYTLQFESDERVVTFGFKAETMFDFLEVLPDFLKAVGFCLGPDDKICMLEEDEQEAIENYYKNDFQKKLHPDLRVTYDK
jgi:hypothetical protein